MNIDTPVPTVTQTVSAPPVVHSALPSLCWSAILGGTVAAIGIHLLLTTLGVGAGLATFTPLTDANPAGNLSMGAAIIWMIGALVSLWFGGLVAGRFSHSLHSGFVHGVLVWSLTLVLTIVLLSVGTSMLLGGALKVIGEGMGMGGKAVASAMGEVTKEGVGRSSGQLSSFIDEAVPSGPGSMAPKAATRAKREIGFAAGKLFAPGGDVTSQDNRTALIKALMTYSEMSETDATKTVDDWITSYKNLKAELDDAKAAAANKAREAADRAAGHLSSAAIWSFFALLLGLLVSAMGGSFGANHARYFRAGKTGVITG